MSSYRCFALGFVVVLALTGCASEPDNAACSPGQSQVCSCSAGKTGRQTCTSDQTFGRCDCGLTVADASIDDTPRADARTVDSRPADAADPCAQCRPDQGCQQGRCVDLPSKCPCPTGSFCDLTTNTCKSGCSDDTPCGVDQYCDLASHRCQKGCRDKSGCAAPYDCIDHKCGYDCSKNPWCPSDGNPCTNDRCVNNSCPYAPVNYAKACTDDKNVCTRDVCVAGKCEHPPAKDGTDCNDGNVCTANVCKAGVCTFVPQADGNSCDLDNNACTDDLCSAGACVPGKILEGKKYCDGLIPPGCMAKTCTASGACVSMPDYGKSCSYGKPGCGDARCNINGQCRTPSGKNCD
ncbi:MAG: hypothetical protein H6707_14760 [Deltaproteobacteria bacterium]|nr:hypothetical protein [Deltaproteobacteria bacterium]